MHKGDDNMSYRNNSNGDDWWKWLLLLIGITCFPYITIPVIFIGLIVSK